MNNTMYKYLYIDDTRERLEEGMINALQDNSNIEITFRGPSDWETIIEYLKTELPKHNGIILDLRLNDIAYAKGKYAQYKGSTVAQELRSLTKEGLLNDFPMILFSGTDKLDHYLDPTSKDLFDKIVDKTKIEQPGYFNYEDFKIKLKWLADGYSFLNDLKNRSVEHIFKMDDLTFFDPRFIDHFNSLLTKPIHIVAHFIIKEVIGKPCFLIDENYLSARMGIDKQSEDWSAFLEKISGCKYTGAFSNYFDRWWMPAINKFWQTEISTEQSLRTLGSPKRIELLIEKTGLQNLNPLSKTKNAKSESFWVSCKATGISIDTVDGFILAGQENRHPWQEPEYISSDEALRPTKDYSVSITERPRLEKLKNLLEKNEQRIRK
ncbi:hypothetical protein SAMN05421857_1158 [Chryseobacterium formosense]|nr:hypothetical protein [Chryseobacterium formosense]SFT46203.1 hypothetical protein SAMN05421857_1158 [Chryseobacterium formosense]